MPARHRDSQTQALKGTWRRFGDTHSLGETVVTDLHSVDDIVHEGDNQNLTITHLSIAGGRLTSQFDPGYYGAYFEGFRVDWLDAVPDHPSLPEDKGDIFYATSAVARTNPSRESAMGLVDLAELHEIPKLVKAAGDALIHKLASGFIKYEFGIAPLSSDLAKLIRISLLIDIRMRELSKLFAKGILKRTIDLDQMSSYNYGNVVVHSNGAFINVGVASTSKQIVRAHCRWSPTAEFNHLFMAKRLRGLLQRALLGLKLDFSTLWELVPWTWFIDWFANIGTFLKSLNNTLPIQLQSVTVMRHSVTVWESDEYFDTNTGILMVPFKVIKENKTRRLRSASLTTVVPVLSWEQLGILGSLASLRIKF